MGLSQLWGTRWATPGTLQPGKGRERANQAPEIKPQVCFYQSMNLAQPPLSALAWASIHPSRPVASSTHSSKNPEITLITQEKLRSPCSARSAHNTLQPRGRTLKPQRPASSTSCPRQIPAPTPGQLQPPFHGKEGRREPLALRNVIQSQQLPRQEPG